MAIPRNLATFANTVDTSGNVNVSSSTKVGNGLFLPAANTLGFTTNTTEVARFDSSGNFGINGAPNNLGANIPTINVIGRNTTNSGGLRLQNSDNTYQFYYYANSGVGYFGADTNHPLAFLTNAAERMRINADGTIKTVSTISVGGAAPSTSGAGITFPATQSASTDVNTLDDYEEGTWTPSLGGTATYTTQAGNYVKIGRLVYAVGTINVNAIGTGSTNNISGLPFTNGATNECNCSIGYLTGSATSISSVSAYVQTGATSMQLTTFAAGGATSVSPSTNIFANSTQIRIQAVYYSNS